MNIAILYGQVLEQAGKDEQDVLIEVDVVSQALDSLGHTPIPVSVSLDLNETHARLQQLQPKLIFNLVESIQAQGRFIHLIPALLDSLKIPYTGTKTEGMFLTSNKLLAKKWLKSAGLPTPCWFSAHDLRTPMPFLPSRAYILKSIWEHASLGLGDDAVIHPETGEELSRLLDQRHDRLGGEGFVEAYIPGREINLSLLAGEHGPEVLPPAEILFDAYPEDKVRIVDYQAKWDTDSFAYQHTPRSFEFPEVDTFLLHQLKKCAKACWELFDLRGYARIDFRVDHTQNPWILEVNANPCLSPDAGFMAAADQAGLRLEQVIERILQDQ